jgi:hypothetical protein
VLQTSAYKIRIRTDSEDGNALMLVDGGELVAILVELADECHGSARGKWIVEATFGLDPARRSGLFASADAAAGWISQEISYRPFALGENVVELR